MRDERRKTMDDGRGTKNDGRWTMDDGRWTVSSLVPRLSSLVIMCLLCSSIAGCGITAAKYMIINKPEEIDVEINAPPDKLRVGEKFTYKAEWLGMDVGIATLSVKEITERNGRQVYHVIATVETTPGLSKVYKIQDEISTYIDLEKLCPVRFEKKQREGSYRSDEYTDFDQEKGKAVYFSRLNHDKKEYDIPKEAQDPLSCLYFLRLKDVDVGQSVFANVIANEKTYLLEAKVLQKGLLKINGVGEWDAFLVEPLPWFQGKLTRKAKATIWFSADEKRIPLLVTTKSIPFVGSVTITLQKVEYLDTDSQ